MLASCVYPSPSSCLLSRSGSGFCCRAVSLPKNANVKQKFRKKVAIIGSGWAGLGAAHHLCNQGFDVTVFEDGDGLGSSDNVGIPVFWYPYRNIFKLVAELGINPFTNWTRRAQYSHNGLEVEFPIYQDLPQLPTPLGALFYTQFARLSFADRLSALPLMAAVIDFDNTDTSWRKYDSITAKELLKQLGCSEKFSQDIFGPLLRVGLFAPTELCSAAATLGVIYYIFFAHQKDFDMVWCRGTIRERIFRPWMELLRAKGCEFLAGKRVTDFTFNDKAGTISDVVCVGEMYNVDAVILASSISTVQGIVKTSSTLRTRKEFLKVLNLASIDVLSVKLQLDRKVNIPNVSNACTGLDDSFGWTFFDLNVIHDKHKEDPVTILQVDFYNASELMPLRDEVVAVKAMSYLSKCIKNLEDATVVEAIIERFPKSMSHFFPGSYKYMMHGSTSFTNMFMAGDWIVNRHASWSQEKSFVTGLEAANRVVDYLEEGSLANIITVEQDEPHVEVLRGLNRRLGDLRAQIPF